MFKCSPVCICEMSFALCGFHVFVDTMLYRILGNGFLLSVASFLNTSTSSQVEDAP